MVIRPKLQSAITYLRANQPTTATPLGMRDHPGLEKRGKKTHFKAWLLLFKLYFAYKQNLTCDHHSCTFSRNTAFELKDGEKRAQLMISKCSTSKC